MLILSSSITSIFQGLINLNVELLGIFESSEWGASKHYTQNVTKYHI